VRSSKLPIKHEQIRKNYGANLGLFLQKPFEVQSLWWNIWVDTPTKLPLAIIESGVLTFKM
jgi:hypothetical protein